MRRTGFWRFGGTLRTRLTVVYSGLFILAALAVLALTWLLLRQRLDATTATFSVPASQPPADTNPGVLVYANGQGIDGANLPQWFTQQQDELRRTALSSLLTRGGLVFAGIGVVALVAAWLLAGRVLAPLHRVTETARRIATVPAVDYGLRERISLAGPAGDEVKRLADTFDLMLARLDRSFDGQRRFVANASHELRTPIATTRGVVELAMRRHRTAELIRLGETLLEINARQEQIIDGLLLLARTEHEINTRVPVDLATIVNKAVAHNAAAAEAAGVLLITATAPATTSGDPVLIDRIVQNLIENAIRYNVSERGWVRVTTRCGADTVTLTVANTGPVIPGHELQGLFDPFRKFGGGRLATDRGSGLGLSIVESITRAHSGTVTAQARVGGGLVITVGLPKVLDR